MAYFAIIYDVVDDFVARRGTFRNAHLQMAQEAHERGEIVLAGALADPTDKALIVFRGTSSESARRFAENDPYVRNGLVTRWEVRPWTVVIGGA